MSIISATWSVRICRIRAIAIRITMTGKRCKGHAHGPTVSAVKRRSLSCTEPNSPHDPADRRPWPAFPGILESVLRNKSGVRQDTPLTVLGAYCIRPACIQQLIENHRGACFVFCDLTCLDRASARKTMTCSDTVTADKGAPDAMIFGRAYSCASFRRMSSVSLWLWGPSKPHMSD